VESVFASSASSILAPYVSAQATVGVGRGRPVVTGALVELERRKAMGGGDSGFKVVEDKGDIGDA
jgi:hypothetical protein